MSSYLKAELAATCGSLGRFHNGKYVIDSQCYESVRDIIRFLRRDDECHEIRRYLGEAKVVQSDLIHIIINCPNDNEELFDLTVRLLVSLTNPVLLLYKEEIPAEKVGRHLYMSLIGYSQEYKVAFCNIDFWKVISGKLTDLFEIDWTERTEDNGLQIERMLVLLRNVLQIPADVEFEKRPENDVTIHDKVLWALRQSQLLELLLYISSNKDEEQYYLHLLEIFSLILREQNPKLLATCEIRRSNEEKERDTNDLIRIRERERSNQNKFKHTRNYNSTFVLKDVKSISDKDVIYHKSLDKLGELRLTQDKKRLKTPKNKFPVESERIERRSTFSVRLFLKEFCVELLNCSYNALMTVVKDKLTSGRGLQNDESYYFWSLKFFLEFNCAFNLDIKLISACVNVQTFHFIQTQLENCFEHLITDKKKIAVWVRRIHLILKAYHSLLQTLAWMDASKDATVRETSAVLKSRVFYEVEYREMMLYVLFKYDPFKFSSSYLRDLIETTHLFLKLLEDFCKKNHVVVQKKTRKKAKKRKERPAEPETYDAKWEKIKDQIYDLLSDKDSQFPDIAPFDALLEIPIEEQKERAMKNIQKLMHEGEGMKAIGLLRSSRQVWPENDSFGAEGMSVEDEMMALQEICLAELGNAEIEEPQNEEEEEEDEAPVGFTEQHFDIKDFIKRLVNKKVVEACAILLKNYKKNASHTNHCAIKLLFRIGWECAMPAMLYQASLFSTLQSILNEKVGDYKEVNKFTIHLIRKFRENALRNPKIYVELLFWKDPKIAYEIENGYGAEESSKKAASWSYEEEDELRRLWMESENVTQMNVRIDWIRSSLINNSRSRISVVKKLKELMLIPPDAKTSAPKVKSGKEWIDEEVEELTRLYNEFKDANDVVTMISDRLTLSRTKIAIKRKLVELGLVDNIAQLKKRGKRTRRKEAADDPIEDDSSDDKVEQQPTYSLREQKFCLQKVEDLKEALSWLKETIEECIEDDDDGSEPYPLLVMTDKQTEALENPDFVQMLRKLGIIEPVGQQVYWKIPKTNRVDLHTKAELIQSAIDGKLKLHDSSESEDEDEFDRLRNMTARKSPEVGESSRRSPAQRMETSDSETERRVCNLGGNESSNDEMTRKSPARGISIDSDEENESKRTKTKKTRIRQAINSESSDSEIEATRKSPKSSNRIESTQKTKRTINSESSESENESTRKSTRGKDDESKQTQTKKTRSRRVVHSREDESSDSETDATRAKTIDSNKAKMKKTKMRQVINSESSEDETVKKSSGDKNDDTRRVINSDDENPSLTTGTTTIGSDDENVTNQSAAKKKRIRQAINSEDESDLSDEERKDELSNGRKVDFLANDDNSNQSGSSSLVNSKRRRCIGSDSEGMDEGSDEEPVRRCEKNVKKPKVIDSDSDFDGGNNSMDEGNKSN